MTAAQHDDQERRAAVDQAAAEACALVAASYAAELDGRPLNAQHRALRARAERLARWLSRDDRKRAHP